MTTIEKSVVVSAPVERVWEAIEDVSSYVSRLEPHTLSFEIVPPGPLSVGQKIHALVAAGKRKFEVFSEVTEVIPGRRMVETHVPNDFFRRMVETVTLEPASNGTLVRFEAEYEPRGFRAWVLAAIFARRAMERNFATTLSNLKKSFEASLPR